MVPRSEEGGLSDSRVESSILRRFGLFKQRPLYSIQEIRTGDLQHRVESQASEVLGLAVSSQT